jgi:hypothetical protein
MKVPSLNIPLDDLITNISLLKMHIYSLIEKIIIDKKMNLSVIDNIQESLLLEPYLYYYLEEETNLDINQILVGYLVDSNQEIELNVKSDFLGYIYLPNLGHLKTKPNSSFILNFKNKVIKLNNEIFEIAKNIKAFNKIVIYNHIPEILKSETKIVNGFRSVSQKVQSKNVKTFKKTLTILKDINEELYEVILLTVNSVFIYDNPEINSFAAMSQHGTIFLNTLGVEPNIVSFLDDISHQSGHVIFNVLTIKTEKYLNCPKSALISEVLTDLKDDRKIYGLFHGLFTYRCILSTLDQYVENKNLHKNEALARIGFYLGKLYLDLNIMNNLNILTKEGNVYYKEALNLYKYFFNKYADFFQTITYSNQNYIFDYKTFKKTNPTILPTQNLIN